VLRVRRFVSVVCGAALLAPLVTPAVAHGASLPYGAVVVVASATFVPGDNAIDSKLGVNTLTVPRGQHVGFMSVDTDAHNITADPDSLGNIAFKSPTVTITNTLRGEAPVDVTGVPDLAPGTYGFHCSRHQAKMRGVLIVT